MLFLMKKTTTLWLFLDGVQLPQGWNENHFEEAVYFLPLAKFPEIAGTNFLSISEGQTTQIRKSDPKKGVSVVAKMLFPQVDKCFWLYYTSF